ncbi:MAG: type II toxin-antitoxin system VapC family toxin [Anaerolineae bacterium]|nr:type II toxin-antitoxin system VapC family toxin [Anaerolineae bacterium]
MNIVIDTSAIIAVIAGEPERDILVNQTKGANLLAPPSVHWEIGNALSAMLKRKRIALDRALEAIGAYWQIPIRFVDISLKDALHIADSLAIYAYDAYLIQTALQYRAPLMSLDTYLIECARKMNADLIEVNQW